MGLTDSSLSPLLVNIPVRVILETPHRPDGRRRIR